MVSTTHETTQFYMNCFITPPLIEGIHLMYPLSGCIVTMLTFFFNFSWGWLQFMHLKWSIGSISKSQWVLLPSHAASPFRNCKRRLMDLGWKHRLNQDKLLCCCLRHNFQYSSSNPEVITSFITTSLSELFEGRTHFSHCQRDRI